MAELVIPYVFAQRTGAINLSELDENFEYLKNNSGTVAGSISFDGGDPTSNYTNGPAFDCGGVT